MNRVPLVPSLLAAAVLASQPAMAGYTFQEGDLSGEVNLTAGGAAIFTHNVNFGAGRIDTRNGEATGNNADWQELYVKPAVSFSYALNPDFDLLAKGSIVAASTFGDGDAGGFTRGTDNRVSAEEAYVGFRAGEWRFTAGRQDYMIGSGFIVMDGNLDFHDDAAFWLAPRTAFRDSAVLGWSRDALSVQAFSLRTDDHLGDYRMNGVNLDYALEGVATFGAMAMKLKSEDRDSNIATPRDGMEVYNIRALNAKLPGVEDLTLNAEYAVQAGRDGDIEYDAKAWYAGAEYAFSDLPLQPKLGYRYAYFSGDEDLADNKREAWDALSKGFVDWGTWLVGDVVGNYLLNNSNQKVHTWSLKTQVQPMLTVGAMHHQFSLDEKNLFGAPVSDRRFADESVIFVDWVATPQLFTSLSYNWVQPKGAAKELLGDKTFSAVEMYFTYRY